MSLNKNKTLGEIIDICKNGDIPNIDDARFAICALDALMVFDSTSLTRMLKLEKLGKKSLLYTAERNFTERFNRVKNALLKHPLEWLGDDSNPDNKHVQERRKLSIKLFNKAMKNELE